MKIRFLYLFFTLSLSTAIHAQIRIEPGDKQINFGSGITGWGVPLFFGADFGVYENITVGGQVTWSMYQNNWDGSDWKHSIVMFLANGNYHFNTLLDIPSPYDVFAGLDAGFSVWNTTYNSPGNGFDYQGTGGSGFFITAHVGARYFFAPDWAAMIQLGAGSIPGLLAGLTFSF